MEGLCKSQQQMNKVKTSRRRLLANKTNHVNNNNNNNKVCHRWSVKSAGQK